ncbi:MarR family winged helix-turn-helix transcriptional regulator [Oenococcus oeni]|uniref:Transcriptional regulator n=3 Tax=Oenococcus oeni TaxID=1247 RepID=A0AAJ2P427_OENOE|nr:MarR family winged helix-turn-helix transcriptional regulator [Oenococcus oeni]EAV38874.1 transcriptional regulator, MarR family [Oenococcus oeni ATCC BAA-1163]EJO01389.1 transcriptional regulator [Oenococcus oeni AWRIB418]KDP19422.1 transcriptional regulator [Oenococcus oeni]KGH58513.1 transcriptional regulator [Oenococcus oeni IOEB_9805]KGH63579.1 transcriptional regulator [Oenococcus oeni S13]
MSRDLGRLLKIASNQMSTRFDIFAKKYDLTGTQMTIIDYLSRNKNKEILQKDLESEFNIKSSTATVLLQRMEMKKLLYRKVGDKDSRQKCLKLTEKANKLETIILGYMNSDQLQMTSGLNSEEVVFLEKILKRMIE